MKNHLINATLIMFLVGITHAVPVVYTNEELYLSDLEALGYATRAYRSRESLKVENHLVTKKSLWS